MGVRENKIETYLDKQVKSKLKGMTRKWENNNFSVPDRIIIISTVVFHIRMGVIFTEVKTVDGELTSLQKREQKRLRDSTAIVCTVYGNTGVDKLINDLLTYGYLEEEEYR